MAALLSIAIGFALLKMEDVVLKRILIPTRSGSDWQRLLARPALHWKIGKSAMTAAVSWEEANDTLPPEIAALLDQSLDENLVGLKLLFCHALDAKRLPGGLAVVQSVKQPRLFLGWCSGDTRFLEIELPSRS
jgi:hypothetical protein